MAFIDQFNPINVNDPLAPGDPRLRFVSPTGRDQILGGGLEARGLTEANIAREQFAPATESLFQTSQQVGLGTAVRGAAQRAERASDVAEGIIGRRQKALGLRLSERQQRAQKRTLGLSRLISRVGATTGVRRGFASRAETARRGAVGLEGQIAAIEAQAEIAQENAAGQEAIREAERRAAKKQARNSLIGNIIGTGAALLAFSDEGAKTANRGAGSLLDKLKKVRVEKWKYIGDDADHIGPYAREFNETFGVGQDNDNMISLVDVMGVTLGAVKELNEKVDGHA